MRKILRIITIILSTLFLLIVCVLIFFRAKAHFTEQIPFSEISPNGGTLIETDDVSVHVQKWGPEDGPPVLLVHGTGSWGSIWAPTATALAEQGYRVIALDLPPFGFSEKQKNLDYRAVTQRKRIQAVIDELAIEEITLVGHSFGARPTVEVALQKPEQVRALILVDAALGLTEDPNKKPPMAISIVNNFRPLRSGLVASTITNKWFTRKLLASFIHDPNDATTEIVSMLQEPSSQKGTTRAVTDWLPSLLAPTKDELASDTEQYKAIDFPVHIIWGDLDTVTPPDQAKHLQELIPDATLTLMQDVGHIPYIEDETSFLTILTDLLSKEY